MLTDDRAPKVKASAAKQTTAGARLVGHRSRAPAPRRPAKRRKSAPAPAAKRRAAEKGRPQLRKSRVTAQHGDQHFVGCLNHA